MSRYHPAWDINSLLQDAHLWLESSFVEDNSLFSACSLWTLENATTLRNAFVDNLLEGSEGFYEKLDMQPFSTPPAAKQLLAEMLWLLMLMQSNIKPTTKRENLAKVWGWSGAVLPPDHPMLDDSVLIGVPRPGTAFNTPGGSQHLPGLPMGTRGLAKPPLSVFSAI